MGHFNCLFFCTKLLFYSNIFTSPTKIRMTPASLLKKDDEMKVFAFIFLPKMVPMLKKINWNIATKNGNKNENPSKILKLVPHIMLSQDKANPSKIVSLKPNVFELLKLETEELFIIFEKLVVEVKL